MVDESIQAIHSKIPRNQEKERIIRSAIAASRPFHQRKKS